MKWGAWWRAVRPLQWPKNLFVAAPLLFGRRLMEPEAVGAAALAVAVFVLLSAAVYLLNDVLDQERDRNHPEKARRPLASGELRSFSALIVALWMAVAGLAASAWLPGDFRLLAVGYLLLMVAYCLWLKHVVVVDAFTVAGGFVVRLMAGAAAVAVAPSHWLIVCAFCLALFLSLAKRRMEVASMQESAAAHRPVLAQYGTAFLEQGTAILAAITAVCYTLYAVSPETVSRFGTDRLVYGAVFVLYGLLRYLHLTQRAGQVDAPERLLVEDPGLVGAVVLWVAYNAWVIYG